MKTLKSSKDKRDLDDFILYLNSSVYFFFVDENHA